MDGIWEANHAEVQVKYANNCIRARFLSSETKTRAAYPKLRTAIKMPICGAIYPKRDCTPSKTNLNIIELPPKRNSLPIITLHRPSIPKGSLPSDLSHRDKIGTTGITDQKCLSCRIPTWMSMALVIEVELLEEGALWWYLRSPYR